MTGIDWLHSQEAEIEQIRHDLRKESPMAMDPESDEEIQTRRARRRLQCAAECAFIGLLEALETEQLELLNEILLNINCAAGMDGFVEGIRECLDRVEEQESDEEVKD